MNCDSKARKQSKASARERVQEICRGNLTLRHIALTPIINAGLDLHQHQPLASTTPTPTTTTKKKKKQKKKRNHPIEPTRDSPTPLVLASPVQSAPELVDVTRTRAQADSEREELERQEMAQFREKTSEFKFVGATPEEPKGKLVFDYLDDYDQTIDDQDSTIEGTSAAPPAQVPRGASLNVPVIDEFRVKSSEIKAGASKEGSKKRLAPAEEKEEKPARMRLDVPESPTRPWSPLRPPATTSMLSTPSFPPATLPKSFFLPFSSLSPFDPTSMHSDRPQIATNRRFPLPSPSSSLRQPPVTPTPSNSLTYYPTSTISLPLSPLPQSQKADSIETQIVEPTPPSNPRPRIEKRRKGVDPLDGIEATLEALRGLEKSLRKSLG